MRHIGYLLWEKKERKKEREPGNGSGWGSPSPPKYESHCCYVSCFPAVFIEHRCAGLLKQQDLKQNGSTPVGIRKSRLASSVLAIRIKPADQNKRSVDQPPPAGTVVAVPRLPSRNFTSGS